MQREVTIYDIAKELQLSPATISRALNDHPDINGKTKRLIVSKANEWGYRPNRFASNLRRQRTNTIGVMIPRLDSAFMSTVLVGMENVASQAGYTLLVSQSFESVKKEITNAKTLFDSRVDGLLVSLASDTENLVHFNSFFGKGVPVILFDQVLPQENGTTVVIDNVRAGYEITRHLLEQGCRRIMHLQGNSKKQGYADRLQGYKMALLDAGLSVDDRLIRLSTLTRQDGLDAADYIGQMAEPPDGLFVASDWCAVSCLGALKQRGFLIPKDIAVAGFNNDPVSNVIEPNLTTIDYPGQEMGEIAALHLINHLNGVFRNSTTNTVLLNHKLVIRGSSQKQSNRT